MRPSPIVVWRSNFPLKCRPGVNWCHGERDSNSGLRIPHDDLSPDREYIDGELRERNVGKWSTQESNGCWHTGLATMNRTGTLSAAQSSGYRSRRRGFAFPIWWCCGPSATGDSDPTASSGHRNSFADDSYSDLQERSQDTPDGRRDGLDHRSQDAQRAHVFRIGVVEANAWRSWHSDSRPPERHLPQLESQAGTQGNA